VSWDDGVERCRALLDDAVASRLRTSGPATSQLSGGIDSSAVVGTIAATRRDELMVGRLIFDGPSADERAYSDAVIDHWKVPAISVKPWIATPDETLERSQRLGRPFPDPHFTMFCSLYRAFLSEGRSNGLTGMGGDDAFVAMRTGRSEEHTSELQSQSNLVCRLLPEKNNDSPPARSCSRTRASPRHGPVPTPAV